VSSKNWDATYASGRDILAQTPDQLDVILVLGSIGYDESLKTPPVTKYNTDTINYAKSAIEKMEAGKPSQNYGAYQYTYSGVKEFPNAKENALGWMNFNIGYLMYFNQNQKKEAIPFLYKAAKSNSAVKNFPVIYQTIGASYFDEAKRLSQESTDKIKAANNTETEESKASYALAKGYADRAIDAYARAYKIASANPATKKEYKDGLYGVIQDLYKFRYNGKIDGIDSYVAAVMSRPMPDPTVAVTPVVEATPAVTPAATASSLTTSNTMVDAGAETSNNTSAKSGVGTAAAKTNASPAAAAKTKAPVKKPAPKKKGTR
jgi:tetratricopeptide (TPR) repeat protein